MKHKASLTISRPSYSDGMRKISIKVKDSDAGIQFLSIEIDLDKFSECLTGLAESTCEMEVRGLQNVGKQIERMDIEFELPDSHYMMEISEIEELAKLATPQGWHCSMYFGSQTSFFNKDGKDYARTTASRWVNKTETNQA